MYLSRTEWRDDDLVLVVGFRANCCPQFSDSAVLEEGRLFIGVKDTASISCGCSCRFEDEFVVHGQIPETLRVDVVLDDYRGIATLDTLVVPGGRR